MQLFLSYASEDRQAAEQIQLALIGAGHEVFFDKTSLPPSSDYQHRIRLAMKKSDALIFLVTPHSVHPKSFCLTELEYARQRWPHPKERVLPVMLEPTPFASIPGYLRAVVILEPTGDVPAAVVNAVAATGGGRAKRLLSFARPLGYSLIGALLLALAYWLLPKNADVTIQNGYAEEVTFTVNGQRSTLSAGTATRIKLPSNGAALQLYSCGWEQVRAGPSGCRWIPYRVFAGQTWDVIPAEPSPRIVMRERIDGTPPGALAQLPDFRPYLKRLNLKNTEDRRQARIDLAAFMHDHSSGALNRAVVAEAAVKDAPYATSIGVAVAIKHLSELSDPIIMADRDGALRDLQSVLLKPRVDDALRQAVESAIEVVRRATPG